MMIIGKGVVRFPIDGVLALNRITSSSSALHGYVIEISLASVVDLAVLGCWLNSR